MLKLLTSASLATALMFSAANAQSPAPAPSPSAPSGAVEVKPPVPPSQFKLGEDRVILNVTGEQAKTLPQISK